MWYRQASVEQYRAEFTLMERTPAECASATDVVTLNLSLAKLRFIDLSPYLALQQLRCVTFVSLAIGPGVVLCVSA